MTKETTRSWLFETPNHRGEMVSLRVVAKSEGVARYRFRRWALARHGIRAHPGMIYLVGGAA